MYECPLLGHPDKMSDILADTILDHRIGIDPAARVACEIMVSKNLVLIGGEIDDLDEIAAEDVIRKKILSLGYCSKGDGLDGGNCRIEFSVSSQSKFLKRAIGVEMNAGDQSIVVGFSSALSDGGLPNPVQLGKRLARELSVATVSGKRPDGKIYLQKLGDGDLSNSVKLSVSMQHKEDADVEKFRENLVGVIKKIGGTQIDEQAITINPPNGSFVFGGPDADSGLTGRKIIAESYGPTVPHGGGALSGKDCTKIDRTGAYGARCLARSLVRSGLISQATVSIGYMIGCRSPIELCILDDVGLRRNDLERHVLSRVDLSLGGFIEFLDLARPIYSTATEYFHYGLNIDLPWERLHYDL
jgi:S-adenosylmethionine synthetase